MSIPTFTAETTLYRTRAYRTATVAWARTASQAYPQITLPAPCRRVVLRLARRVTRQVEHKPVPTRLSPVPGSSRVHRAVLASLLVSSVTSARAWAMSARFLVYPHCAVHVAR
jgi:hypothetical protein